MSPKIYTRDPFIDVRNNSPAGGDVEWYNVIDEMEAFDSLPPSLRAVLRDAPIEVSAEEILPDADVWTPAGLADECNERSVDQAWEVYPASYPEYAGLKGAEDMPPPPTTFKSRMVARMHRLSPSRMTNLFLPF